MRTLWTAPPLLRVQAALCKGGALLLLAAAPAAAPDARLAALFDGDFDTIAQFAAAPAELKVEPSVAGDWLTREAATMRRVGVPALGGQPLLLEWRRGGPAGPVSRQRLWVFRMADDRPVMDFYTLREPLPPPGTAAGTAAAAALTPVDLKGYGAPCAVVFEAEGTAWRGAIDPARCRIVAASGRAMRIAATIRVDARGFDYQEAGTLDDGGVAFRVPPSRPYEFRRRAAEPRPS